MRITTLWVCIAALSGLFAAPIAGANTSLWSGQSNLADPEALIESMRHRGAAELPLEAVTYYEAGLRAMAEGDTDAAVSMFNNALLCDPAFPEAHLALARVHFPKRQAFAHLWLAGQAATRSFGAQHTLLVNLVMGPLLVFVLGALVVVVFSLAQLFSRVHHVLQEILGSWFPKVVGTVVAVLILVAPFFWGVGFLPAAVLLAGFFWWWMAEGARKWTLALVGVTCAAPLFFWAASPVLFHPMDPKGLPYLLSRSMSAPDSPSLRRDLQAALRETPEDPNLHFALAMLDKRGNRLKASWDRYETAYKLGGPASAIQNNLGVVAFHQGRYDEAVQAFKESVSLSPKNAAPHYNLSQAYAKKLYFDKADEELREANRLSYSRIREMIVNQTPGTNGTLLDEPLPASAFWKATLNGPHSLARIPSWLSPLFPGPMAWIPAFVIPFFLVGLGLGRKVNRMLMSFACTNCEKPVCRRCLRRIKKKPYCESCGDALLQIQSAAFSKLVLNSRFQRTNRLAAFLGAGVAWIVPGYHALNLGRTSVGAGIVMAFAAGLAALVQGSLPVSRMAWIHDALSPWWPEAPLALIGCTIVVSWITVVKLGPAEVEPTEAESLYDDEYGDYPAYEKAA